MTLPQTILNALQKHFNITSEKNLLLEPINEGLSLADTYLLGVNDTRMLLRHQKEEATENHWNQQIIAIKALENSGVIPEIYLVDEKLQFYVMEYIENLDFASQLFDESKAPQVIGDFFHKLKAFHQTKIDQSSLVVRDFLEVSQSQYQSYKNNLPEWIIAKVESSTEAFHKIQIPENGKELLTFCHGDLNPMNILYDQNKGVLFIDLETVTIANPMMDIAAFLNFFNMDQEMGNNLLGLYLGEKCTDMFDQLTYQRAKSALGYGVMFASMIGLRRGEKEIMKPTENISLGQFYEMSETGELSHTELDGQAAMAFAFLNMSRLEME